MNTPTPDPKTIPWEDKCPLCNEKAIDWCRCHISHRRCVNNHSWHWEDDKKIIDSLFQ